MIDGFFKDHIDPHWDRLAKPLAKILTANQVTMIGFLLVLLTCAAFLLHHNLWIFGLCLSAAFACDSLDGAVARLRGESSKFGGYFDAVVDRYQELVVFICIAFYAELWPVCMLAFSGAVLTSYAKARTAIETKISNTDWPDLFERQERIIFICLLLFLAGVAPAWNWHSISILQGGMWLLAGLCHLTALQRFFRARRLLKSATE